MISIELRVIDSDDSADRLARRLVRDLSDTDGVAGASLLHRPGAPGERGLVGDIGSLAVKLTTGGAVEAVVGLVKSVLPQADGREIVVKLPNGSEFALKGGSEKEFAKATHALLALLARGSEHEKA